MADPITVYTAIATLASVVQALQAGAEMAGGIRKFFAAEKQKQARGPAAQAMAEALSVIDPRYLDALNENIQKASDKLIADINSSVGNAIQRQFALEQAKAIICNELRTIKYLNRGLLGDGEFIRLWQNHGCDN